MSSQQISSSAGTLVILCCDDHITSLHKPHAKMHRGLNYLKFLEVNYQNKPALEDRGNAPSVCKPAVSTAENIDFRMVMVTSTKQA